MTHRIILPEGRPRAPARGETVKRWIVWGVFAVALLVMLVIFAPVLLPIINGSGRAR